MYLLLSAGGAKLEVAAPFKLRALQAYPGSNNRANKHQNQSCW